MKLTATIAALAIGAATLTACSGNNDDRYAEVACVDRATNIRVDDWRCNNTNSDPNYMLWYLAAGQSMFGYGQRAPYGSAALPQGYRARTITVTPPTSATSQPRTSTAPGTSTKPSTSSKPAPSSKPKVETAKPPTQKPAPKPKPAPNPAKPAK